MNVRVGLALSIFATACGGTEKPSVAPTPTEVVVPATKPEPPAPFTSHLGMESQAPSTPALEQAVAHLRPRFRSCYNKGLRKDPTITGGVVLGATIGPDGQIVSTSAFESRGLPAEVVECLLECVKSGTFPAPDSESSAIRIPVRFEKRPAAPVP